MSYGFWGIPVRIEAVPTNPINTDVSTVDTVHRMIALARSASSNQSIHVVCDSILRSLPKNPSNRDLARAVWWWVKNNVRFEEDETILSQELGYSEDPFQELLISPVVIINMPVPQGDCDDFTDLTLALLICLGFRCTIKVVAVDEATPWKWSHVYCKVWLADEGTWMVMDNSFGLYPGWETQRRKFREAEWLVN